MPLDDIHARSIARRAMKAELLTAEVEQDLGRAWRDRGDRDAMHRLVASHMRLAVSMAGRFRRYGVPMPDLMQEAHLALMKAAEKFDPERGVRFSSYATWWIRAGLQDYVMRQYSLVRTGSTRAQKTLFFNLRRLQARFDAQAQSDGQVLDSASRNAEIARELGLSLAVVQAMEGRMVGGDASLDITGPADSDGPSWVESIVDENADTEGGFARDEAMTVLQQQLALVLGGLSAREQMILRERRLTDSPRTLESLGEELGLSKERVRQIEAATLNKLRSGIEARLPEAAEILR